MKKRILVTGVGAIIGYGIIKSLRKAYPDIVIIGVDIYDDAFGQILCDEFVQCVPAASEEYEGFMLNLVEEKKIDLIIPGIEQDISKLIQCSKILNHALCSVVLNNHDLIYLADDKWVFHKVLQKAKIQCIPTVIDNYDKALELFGEPMLLKPRRSYASKGIVSIKGKREFEYWKEKLGDNFMVQKIVGSNSEEYTAAIFGFGDGTSTSAIVLKRILSTEGATAKAQTVECDKIIDKIKILVKHFKPIGPTNIQFRKHDGEYLPLEINPRISSSTSIRTLLGYNEAKMCVEYYIDGIRPTVGSIVSGKVIRAIEDYITYEKDSNNFRYPW